MTRRFLVPLALLALTGCAGQPGGYPSLAPREAEKQGFDEPARPAAPLVADPALDAEIGRRGAEIDRLAAGFDAAAAVARTRVERARGRPPGSDPWLDAQASLASLDDWRGRAGALAAAIEAMASARAGALQPAYPALDALAARAGAESAREAAAVDRLQGELPAG